VLKDKRISIEARKPFLLIQKSINPNGEANGVIEPTKNGLTKGQKTQKLTSRPGMLGHVEDIRTLPRKYRMLVRSVYQFFEKRAACRCDECGTEFFEPLARKRRRPRWNALPVLQRKCLLTNRSPGNRLLEV
jgi:hypothetical protein